MSSANYVQETSRTYPDKEVRSKVSSESLFPTWPVSTRSEHTDIPLKITTYLNTHELAAFSKLALLSASTLPM